MSEPQADSSSNSGDSNGVSNLITVRGIARIVMILTSIVAFGCIADIPYYSHNSRFSFMVAAGVLSFLWCLLMTFVYILKGTFRNILGKILAYAEMGIDIIMLVLIALASILVADWCETNRYYREACKDDGRPIGSIVFGFFTAFIYIVCIVFDFMGLKSA